MVLAGAISFRVPQGVLACRSAVFWAMFDLGRIAVDDRVDGWPTISLSDERKRVVFMLGVLYNGVIQCH